MADEQYTAKDYLHAFRRRSKLFFGIFAAVLGIALAFAYFPPDTYTASSEIRIDLEGPNIELVEPVVQTTYADQYVKSLQQKVMTRQNLRTWLEESNAYWYEDEEFTQGELVSRLRNDIGIRMVFTSVFMEGRGAEVDIITGFRTTFTSRDPEVAANVANAVAAAFLAEDRATRVDSAASAADFLQEQISAKREEISDIEATIATFKEENAGKLPELMVLNMTTLERTERELEQVRRDIRTLQQDRFFRDAQLQEIRQRVGGDNGNLAQLEAEYNRVISLYGPDHPDVSRIRRQVSALTAGAAAAAVEGESGLSEIAQLQAELAVAQERYSDEHPDVINLKRRVNELRASGQLGNGDASLDDPVYLQLRAQINAIDSNLEGLRERAEDLRDDRARLQDRLASMPQVERQYQQLQRELQTATLAFNGLRERLAQAQQIESFESGERGARLRQITAAAAPSSPTGPPRLAIVILGLFAATTLGGGAAFLSEFSDNTIRGSKDVRVVMQTQAIARIPVVQNSISRAQNRRNLLITAFSATMLAAIIFLIVAAISN